MCCGRDQFLRHLDGSAELGLRYCLAGGSEGARAATAWKDLLAAGLAHVRARVFSGWASAEAATVEARLNTVLIDQWPTQRPVFPRVVAFGVLDGLALVPGEHAPGHAVVAGWCQEHVQTFRLAYCPPQRLAGQVCRLHFDQVSHAAWPSGAFS